MKPIKNRFHCKDCGKSKMLFETEKKANTFIKFNSSEIQSETGFSPTRSYFCVFCNGWHVTSSEENLNKISRTEKVMDLYNQEIHRKAVLKEKKAELREIKIANTIKQLEAIERNIIEIKELLLAENIEKSKELLNLTEKEFEFAKGSFGNRIRKLDIQEVLNSLKKEIYS